MIHQDLVTVFVNAVANVDVLRKIPMTYILAVEMLLAQLFMEIALQCKALCACKCQDYHDDDFGSSLQCKALCACKCESYCSIPVF